MRRLYVIALLPILFCGTVRAQTLAERVPGDAIAYLGWKGTDAAANGYAGSHLQAVVDASGFAELRDQLIPQLMQKINSQSNDHGQRELAVKTMLDILWRHPSAAFFSGIKDPNGAAVPKLGLICQAGTESDALLTIFNAGVQQSGASSAQRAFVSGDCTVMTIGFAGDDAIPTAADFGKSLKADANFTRMTTEVAKDPMICAYVDMSRIVAQIDDAIANGTDENAKTLWPKGRDASGLTGIKHIAFGAGFDGRDWQTSSFVDAPAPRTGLLTVLEPAPIDPILLARIPATANTCALGQFNLGLLLTQIRSTIVAANPGAGDLFDKGMGLVQMMIGRNLQRDILSPLGSQWASYTDDLIPPATVTVAATQPAIKRGNLVVVNKLVDAAKAQQGWTMLSYAITNAGAGFIQKYHLPISTSMTKNGDEPVFTITTPYAQPSWTISDGFMYFGMSPEGVTTAAKLPSGPLITQQPAFVDLAKQLDPAGTFTEFQYANLPKSAPAAYADTEASLEKLRPILEQQSITLPEHILPPLDKLLPELAPALKVSWADASGWHSRSREPFPISSPQSDQMTVGVTALATSILLPSLNRARETANRIKCATNERQMGMDCLLWANNHNGHYPASIADILTQDPQPQIFLCPSSNTSLPANAKAMAPEALAAWLTDHGDYVYVGAGSNAASTGADQIIVYEKPENHGQGMNILFGDGHVEFVKIANAVQLINDQHKTVPTVKLPDVAAPSAP
jgi:prepilin-type processing-associated H-X9-DG protein